MSQQLNLFNPLFLRQKKYFSSRTMLRGLAVVLAALATLHVFQRLQLASLEHHSSEADQQLKTAQQQLANFAAEAKRGPSKVLMDEATRLEAQLQAREALLEGLDGGGLGNTAGFSRYLAALARQTAPGVWLTGFSANGSDGPLAIRGRLLRPELLPSYIRMLNREDALRGHGFSDLRLTAREDKVAPVAGKGDNAANAGVRYVEFTLGATKTIGAAK